MKVFAFKIKVNTFLLNFVGFFRNMNTFAPNLFRKEGSLLSFEEERMSNSNHLNKENCFLSILPAFYHSNIPFPEINQMILNRNNNEGI